MDTGHLWFQLVGGKLQSSVSTYLLQTDTESSCRTKGEDVHQGEETP